MTAPDPLENFPIRRMDLLLALSAVLLPVAVWQAAPPWAGNSYGPDHQLFELFGLTGGLVMTVVVLREGLARRARGVSWLPVAAGGAVGFHTLSWLTENAQRSWDWSCYEAAARALLAGGDPYGDCYLYPPLPAKALVGLMRLAAALLGAASTPERTSWLAFYFYTCAQVGFAVLAFVLAYRFGKRAGLSPTASALACAAALTAANPVLRTLKHGQINLAVLDTLLVALLALPHRPVLAGLALALGAHLKLFPLALAAALGLAGERRVAAATAGGALAIAVLTTDPAGEWTLWRGFLAHLAHFPTGTYFRDNSLDSLFANLARAAGATPAAWPVVLAKLALLAWFARRFVARQRARPAEETAEARMAVLTGHALDALAFALAAAPLAWEHHFTLAIPLVLFAAAVNPGVPVAVGTLLMLALPTFDVLLLGHHRLAGLLLIVAALAPRRAP